MEITGFRIKILPQEVDEHIRNLSEKFGPFKFAASKTPFEPEFLNSYIREYITKSYKNETYILENEDTIMNANVDDSMENPNEMVNDESDDESENKLNDESDQKPIDESNDKSEYEWDDESDDEYQPEEPSYSIQMEPLDIKTEDLVDSSGEPPAKKSRFFDPTNESTNAQHSSDLEFDCNNLTIENTDQNDLYTLNVAACKDSLQQFTNDFNKMCQMNTELNQNLTEAMAEIESLKKSLGEALAQKQNVEKKSNDLNRNNEDLIKQINDLNTQNEQLMEKQRNIGRKADEAKQHAIDECKQEHLHLIDDAKKNKYCVACGKAKLLDIYVCDMECQRELLKYHT